MMLTFFPQVAGARLTLFFLAALTLLCTPMLRAQTYNLVDLGVLPGTEVHSFSSANGINDQGVITGATGPFDGTDGLTGITWQSGTMTALPAINTAPTYSYSVTPLSINSSGQCVGSAYDLINGGVPFLYSNGAVNSIASSFASGLPASATAINNARIIVGEDGQGHACYITNGVETALPLMPALSQDTATAINNQTPPKIVGNSSTTLANRAILWKNGVAQDLGTLGGPNGQATGINDHGQVVGYADTLPDANGVTHTHAFLWTPGGTGGVAGNPQMTDLGTFLNGTFSRASAINNAGQIVGGADYNSSDYAFLWDAVNGLRSLNALVATATYSFTATDGTTLGSASGINNQGQIIGSLGMYTNGFGYSIQHGYVLTPLAAQAAPGAPFGLTVAPAPAAALRQGALRANVTGATLNLSWQLADATASDIYVERQTGTNAFTQISDQSGDVTSYSDMGLAPGVYTYRVRAHNSTGDSAYSNSASATVAITTSHTQLLWDNVNGQAALWTVSSDGSYTPVVYGPYSGWTAKAVAAGPDGATWLLWTSANGTASLWNITGSGATYRTYGPFPGYTAVSLSVGSDGSPRLLWDKTDGTALLWTVNYTNATFTYTSYGPYPGWTAKSVASGNTVTDLLWTKTDGTASGFRIAADNSLTYHTFGPYSGYAATSMSVGPDDGAHLLWDSTNGTASLWSVDFSSGAFNYTPYGPYSGWSAKAIATGPDNVTHILWNATNSTTSLWSVTATGSSYTFHTYGPFSGWTAVGVSAGP